MTTPYTRWASQLAAASDEAGLEALRRELVMARVRALSDMVAQREATWALSQVFQKKGDLKKAAHMARELLQLVDSPPVASNEEVVAVQAWLGALGEKAPEVRRLPQPDDRRGRGRRERGERPPRRDRPERLDPVSAARAAGLAGDFGEAFKLLRKRRGGAEIERLRVWLHVARALSLEGEARETQLRETEAWLRKRAGLPAAEGASAPAPRPAPEDDPLAVLVGRALPSKRGARVRVVEKHAAAHPEMADALAAAAIRQHVAEAGADAIAPWWTTLVARALATTDGNDTRAALADLGEAAAARGYDAAPFPAVLAATRASLDAGHRLIRVHRGVLRGGAEPDDRRVWTIRVSAGGVERQLAMAPASDEPYAEGLAAELAARLVQLCPTTVLMAEGAGNAALVEAAKGCGVAVLGGTDAAVAIATLGAIAPPEAAAPPAAEPRESEASSGERNRRKKHAGIDELVALLVAEPRDIEAMAAAMRVVRRRRTVAVLVSEHLPGSPDDAIADIAAAAVVAWPGDGPLPEITSMLVDAAARGGTRCRALLDDARLGGEGLGLLVDASAPAVADGWRVDRVIRGATRRERETSPAVASMAEGLRDLWRGVLVRGDVRCEFWAVEGLPAEGRGAVPQLLLADRQRVVVLPIDPDLLAWWAGVGGPEAIGWTGEEGAEIVAALAALEPAAS